MTVPVPPSTDDQFLLDFIRDRDLLCPCCQYNLRNLTVARCPECGNQLRLSVGYVEPSQAAWIIAFIGLAAGAGVGLLAALTLLRNGIEWAQPWEMARLGYFIACIPLTVVLVVKRRRFLRLHPRIQRAIGFAAVIGTPGVIFSLLH